jgi:hypothetical protein
MEIWKFQAKSTPVDRKKGNFRKEKRKGKEGGKEGRRLAKGTEVG